MLRGTNPIDQNVNILILYERTNFYKVLISIKYNLYSGNDNLQVVEDIGVEPMTLCVQGRCSSQLS